MAIETKKYLDYPGLDTYDKLIKAKITYDIESLGSFLEGEINTVSDSVESLNTKFENSSITDEEILDLFED